MTAHNPAKPSVALRNIRRGMARATQKFSLSGHKKTLKPITLRRADYERQRGGQ